mmetsp:Transcript_10738/g.14009  ORF Transcript_10738/g.14009 Transcript_10738/m.14009 type:complete len:156 (+) Transcript_10738:86-553(+)|eukprot:CAMPEP_0116052742 /NCGR_PEP_ID=MMETSP0322-20121206/1748_1 /TAXON_ID=163516 /ORGANISM="Leptocylindrus danicus var. apora, Strain B651" /LENGTH=155 /DNA_ID=CAMNT_0003535723 /DNA_START=46 /DNA_END=513 /DNA_ORIENTATION=+
MRIQRSSSVSWHGAIPILGYMALGALAYSVVSSKWTYPNTAARRERIPGKAWTLVVTLTFKSKEDQEYILEEWKPVTEYCANKELFLYHYEAGRSDSDPLKLYMVERYESKDDYLNVHKSGEEFLKFRPKLKALQDEGKVTVEGFSYQELGYGFV